MAEEIWIANSDLLPRVSELIEDSLSGNVA